MMMFGRLLCESSARVDLFIHASRFGRLEQPEYLPNVAFQNRSSIFAYGHCCLVSSLGVSDARNLNIQKKRQTELIEIHAVSPIRIDACEDSNTCTRTAYTKDATVSFLRRTFV